MRTYTLSRPVVIGGTTIESLTLPDEVLAKHVEATDPHKGQTRKALALIAECAGLKLTDVREFPARDIAAIGAMLLEGLEDFLDDSGNG